MVLMVPAQMVLPAWRARMVPAAPHAHGANGNSENGVNDNIANDANGFSSIDMIYHHFDDSSP